MRALALAAWSVPLAVVVACSGQDPLRAPDAAAPVATDTDSGTASDSAVATDSAIATDAKPSATDAKPSAEIRCASQRCGAQQMCCTSSTAFLAPVDSACEARAADCVGGGVAVLCDGAGSCPADTVCCAFRRFEEAGALYEHTRVGCVARAVCPAPNLILCNLESPVCPSGTACKASDNGQFGQCE